MLRTQMRRRIQMKRACQRRDRRPNRGWYRRVDALGGALFLQMKPLQKLTQVGESKS